MATFKVYQEYPFKSSDRDLPHELLKAIKTLTDGKYEELVTRNPPNDYSPERIHKVLASVALVDHSDNPSGSKICLVALGAGSRTIAPQELSKDGTKVFDCHAEILARRCLLRFLYAQLKVLVEGDREKSIFERDSTSPEKFALKKGLSFHLYISKPPCGDASVYKHHVDNNPMNEKNGIARVIVHDGEGAGKVPPEPDPTFEQLKSEEKRLYKMTCSDKIAKWNVAGIQGALLSLLIPQPIYLESITIGYDYSEEHMSRAVHGRMRDLTDLPNGYMVKKAKLSGNETIVNEKTKGHHISLTWCCLENGSETPYELIDSHKGTIANSGRTSRLAKLSLFKCFLDLSCTCRCQEYQTVKSYARSYKEVTQKVFTHFKNFGEGSRWLHMPPDVDKFTASPNGALHITSQLGQSEVTESGPQSVIPALCIMRCLCTELKLVNKELQTKITGLEMEIKALKAEKQSIGAKRLESTSHSNHSLVSSKTYNTRQSTGSKTKGRGQCTSSASKTADKKAKDQINSLIIWGTRHSTTVETVQEVISALGKKQNLDIDVTKDIKYKNGRKHWWFTVKAPVHIIDKIKSLWQNRSEQNWTIVSSLRKLK